MLERIRDLAEQLSGLPLVSDHIGDDMEQAVVALQALTALLMQRDLREKMARWEAVRNGQGRMVKILRPDQPPTPEEAEEGARNLQEMCESGQAPAAGIWDNNSTVRSSGRPMSRAEYQAYLAKNGRAEISGYDLRNGTGAGKLPEKMYTEAEVAEQIKRAMAFGKETGQIKADGTVPEGMPVIPMPVVERPGAVKPRPQAPPDLGPTDHEDIPLAQRKHVDTQPLMNRLLDGALKAAKSRATSGVGVPS